VQVAGVRGCGVVTRRARSWPGIEDLTGSVDVVLFPRVFEQTACSWAGQVVVVLGKVDARAGRTRASGSAGSPVEAELEAESRLLPSWLMRRGCGTTRIAHPSRAIELVRIPTGDAGLADRLEAVLARHPGTDDVCSTWSGPRKSW
jgi:hypothetical protein